MREENVCFEMSWCLEMDMSRCCSRKLMLIEVDFGCRLSSRECHQGKIVCMKSRG
jgi:hypothetical protein